MRPFQALLALLSLLAAAPVATAHPPDRASTRFDPVAFFTGHTQGTGRLKIVMRPTQAVDVSGYGRVEPDGSIVLTQIVEQKGKDPKHRTWRIREVSPGRYAGTLTDAVSPVSGTVIGGRLRLRYRMKGGLHATQWLDAAPDARSAHNLLTVTRMGLPVAHLDETIRRTGP